MPDNVSYQKLVALWEKAGKAGSASIELMRPHPKYTTVMEPAGTLWLHSCGAASLSAPTFYGTGRKLFTRKGSARGRAKDTLRQLGWQ